MQSFFAPFSACNWKAERDTGENRRVFHKIFGKCGNGFEDTGGGGSVCLPSRPVWMYLPSAVVLIPDQVQDDVHAFLNADQAGIQGDVVVLSRTPLPVGVVLVIHPAAGVLVRQALLRGLLRLAVQADDAVGPELHTGVDEGVEAVVTVLQDVVGAPAHNDAWALVRQVPDHPVLDDRKRRSM